ncbi:MAG: glycosyltransferase family 4 protein [Anaerolineaceae bacterium]|nr:glycosyltransferase family 4 protein [Anaerolineaceae bacterium]
MKIVMFSINPLFPDVVMGGASKHLQKIAIHLGVMGNKIEVLCPYREDTGPPFYWHKNVRVFPILPFNMPFPNPYEIPAFKLAQIIQIIADFLKSADRFYIHDGELLLPFLYTNTPTVVSLRDNIYPESILGSFLFQGSSLITVSKYSRDIVMSTAGRFFPDLKNHLISVNNGIDLQKFKKTEPENILSFLPVDPKKDIIILHPHRPETEKGLPQTIEVINKLVNEYQIKNIKALIPKWLDTSFSVDVRSYYQDLNEFIITKGLEENFIFHDWVPQTLIAEYFSLGTLTLGLGSIVEAFGNSVYESLACQTPAIVSRVAVHRSLMPDSLLPKVDFGDSKSAAAIAVDIIQKKNGTSSLTMDYLRTHLNQEKQLDAYANAILNAKKGIPLEFRSQPITKNTRFTLSPWCYQSTHGIFHDFKSTVEKQPHLISLLEEHDQAFTQSDAIKQNIAEDVFSQWLEEGYIVPEYHRGFSE